MKCLASNDFMLQNFHSEAYESHPIVSIWYGMGVIEKGQQCIKSHYFTEARH